MTTPIEAGADALFARWPDKDGTGIQLWTDPRNVSGAVFGSIDPEGLARALYVADFFDYPKATSDWDGGELPADMYARYRRLADAILAWLTGSSR